MVPCLHIIRAILYTGSPGLTELQLTNSQQPQGPRPFDRINEHATLSERERRQEKKKRLSESPWGLTSNNEPSSKRQNTTKQRCRQMRSKEPRNVGLVTRSNPSRNINVAKKSEELIDGLAGGSTSQLREPCVEVPEEEMFDIPVIKLRQYEENKRMSLGSDEDDDLSVEGGTEVVYARLLCLRKLTVYSRMQRLDIIKLPLGHLVCQTT